MSTSKTANIKTDKDTTEALQKNNHQLCFVKKIGDSDHIVWPSYDNGLNNKTLSWSSDYSIYGSNKFQESMQGETSCNPTTINLRQEDENGGNCLTAKKEYEKIHQE